MQPLVEKYKPATLAEFAGMERARMVLTKFAAEPYSSAWLLVGPAGTGKTTMAFAAAKQIGGEIYHLPAKACDLEAVNRVCGKCHYRPWQGNWNHCIIDEADQMSPAAQLAFLSKLDSTAAPPDTIFWFTANDTRLLQDRFLSRCRKLTFDTAGLLQPGAALLAKIWKAETRSPAPDFRAVMQAAGCNVREALMLIETEILAPGASYDPKPARPEPPARARHTAGRPAARIDPRIPPAGTVLVREFRGKRISVEVLADGFQFKGRPYSSLSAIAGEVAQGNRNGYTFFGLTGANQ